MKKSIPLGAAESIDKMIDKVNDKDLPDGIRSAAYFALLDIKQNLIDKECYEMASDFKKIEEWNDCHMPFKDLKGEVVLVKD